MITIHRNKHNQLWVADMTYVPTWAGFLYLSVVIDVFSRKVAGWFFGANMVTSLVIDALNMVPVIRKLGEVIHHSDHGSQYTSIEFGKRCREMGIAPLWTVLWAMPMTTQWPRVFLPAWNVN